MRTVDTTADVKAVTPDTQSKGYRDALARLRPAMGGALAFSAIVNILMLTGSIYMLQVYDRVLSSGSVPTLVGLFAVVVILYGFLAFYDFLRTRLLSRAAARLDDGIADTVFRRWLRSGLTMEAATSADTTPANRGQGGASRTTSDRTSGAQVLFDLDTVRGFISGPALSALFDVPFVPLFLGVLFLIHPWLGLLTVAGAAVGALIALVNRHLIRRAIQRSTGLDKVKRDYADSGRRNAEMIVAMGMETSFADRWRRLHRETLANGQAAGDPSEALTATSKAFRMLLQSAILTLGAFLVLRGEISPGMIIASSVLSGRALAPVDQLIGHWRTIGRASGAHRRLHAACDMPLVEPRRIDLPEPTGQITVTGLTRLGLTRPGGERPAILSHVSFSLSPGEAMGVLGASACGKSTLARLLVGGAVADAGEIRLDGATRDQWDPTRLGRQTGYLPQHVEMLPGSVRDNIARFDPNIDDATVIAAARLTGVHDIITGLPDGYATMMGEADAPPLLSGGQIQRLGLARAVCGMPAFVVLDEPNSNLDVAGDAALTRTIEALRAAGSTVVVMAHRPSVLAAVNRLMLLDRGAMRAFGDKDDILSETFRVPAHPDAISTAPSVAASSAHPSATPTTTPTAPIAPRPAATPRAATAASTTGRPVTRTKRPIQLSIQPDVPGQPNPMVPAAPLPEVVSRPVPRHRTPLHVIASKDRSHLPKMVQSAGPTHRRHQS